MVVKQLKLLSHKLELSKQILSNQTLKSNELN